jgi:hypothetical protein
MSENRGRLTAAADMLTFALAGSVVCFEYGSNMERMSYGA